ncbi:MAG: glutathione S-transferase family protein [Alphaproteobacteria bacterium]
MKCFAMLCLSLAILLPGAASAQAPAPAKVKAAPAPHIVIYGAEGRRSERIVWLCEELGLPYELHYRRGDVAGSFEDIRKVNPGMAVAPTVLYNGQLLMESGAIMQLILAREGKGRLMPAVNSTDFPGYLLFMNYAEGTMAADVVADYRVARATTGMAPRGKETDGQRAMHYADDFLALHPYFGGSAFSAADIMMVFPISYAVRMNVAEPSKYPHIADWQKRVEERPAFKRMLAAARPDGRVSPPPSLKVE